MGARGKLEREMTFPIRVGANALIVRYKSLLLVEFNDETSVHYNLPGGGIKAGESIKEGLRREVYEETCAEVGDLAFVTEYEPARNARWGGETHKLSLIFSCRLGVNSQPRFPDRPDACQTDVRWVPLVSLNTTELLPYLGERLISHLGEPKGAVFLEEPLEPDKIHHLQ